MFDFLKSNSKENDVAPEEERQIAKARKYLEDTHREYLSKDEYHVAQTAFHYVKTTTYGIFTRYHFYRGFDENLIYVVLSDRERKIVINAFKSKAGKGYAYHDTIMTRGEYMKHRFYKPNQYNTSLTYMEEGTGKIWGGNFDMDC